MPRHIRKGDALSKETSLKGALQRACLELLAEHEQRDELPTSVRFLYYELVQRRVLSKSDKHASRRLTDALMYLRLSGHIEWDWIVDETRDLNNYSGDSTIKEGVLLSLNGIRIDPWDGDVPLIITESRSLAGVLDDIAAEYAVMIASTNGQAGGFLRTAVAPLLNTSDRVLYLGDHDHQGHQIEANTRTVLEDIIGGDLDWERIALTDEQVAQYDLERLTIMKPDNRYRPPREHPAIETEALQQSVIVAIVRDKLEELLPEALSDVAEREVKEREALRRLLTRRPRRRR
jgi:hypothetical protein